jgi:hypothetical protein
MEVLKVEQKLYMQVAVLCSRNAWECHAERLEALSDHVLLYQTVARLVQALRRGNM